MTLGTHLAFSLLTAGLYLNQSGFWVNTAIFVASIIIGMAVPFWDLEGLDRFRSKTPRRKRCSVSYPYNSKIVKAKNHLPELRVQHQGYPYRILYAFDPRKVAILLLGSDKTGQDRWYQKSVPLADKLYDEHIKILRQEGLIPKPR